MKSEFFYKIEKLINLNDIELAQVLLKENDDLDVNEKLELKGNILFEKGDYEGALQEFEKVFLRSKDYFISRFYYLAAVQSEKNNEFSAAFSYYRSAIETEPIYCSPYIDLAGLLAKIQDFDGAIKCLERAIEHDPYDIRIFENLAILYKSKVENGENLFCEKFLKLQKKLPALRLKLKNIKVNSIW